MNYNINNQLSMIDILSVLSFIISVINLDENLSQSDKQDLQSDLSNKIEKVINEIHGHLKQQDIKLDNILKEVSK